MIEAFEDGILEGVAISQICLNIGIAEVSFYRHRLEDADFESTIVRAQTAAQDANIDRIEAMAAKATIVDWQLVQFQCRNAQWVAGRRARKKYGDRTEITGEGGGAIQIVSTIPRPPKEGE